MITCTVDIQHQLLQTMDEEVAVVVVVLMYFDIEFVVVVYSNHSLVVEMLVDHVAIENDLVVIDVDMDASIEDLKMH